MRGNRSGDEQQQRAVPRRRTSAKNRPAGGAGDATDVASGLKMAAAADSPLHLLFLPEDVLSTALAHLPAADLAAVDRTCSYLRSLTSAHWTVRARERFGEPPGGGWEGKDAWRAGAALSMSVPSSRQENGRSSVRDAVLVPVHRRPYGSYGEFGWLDDGPIGPRKLVATSRNSRLVLGGSHNPMIRRTSAHGPYMMHPPFPFPNGTPWNPIVARVVNWGEDGSDSFWSTRLQCHAVELHRGRTWSESDDTAADLAVVGREGEEVVVAANYVDVTVAGEAFRANAYNRRRHRLWAARFYDDATRVAGQRLTPPSRYFQRERQETCFEALDRELGLARAQPAGDDEHNNDYSPIFLLGCEAMLIVAREGRFYFFVPGTDPTAPPLTFVRAVQVRADLTEGMCWASPEVAGNTFACSTGPGRIRLWRAELLPVSGSSVRAQARECRDEQTTTRSAELRLHNVLDLKTAKRKVFQAIAVSEGYVAASTNCHICIYSHSCAELHQLAENEGEDGCCMRCGTFDDDDNDIDGIAFRPLCMYAQGELLVSASLMGGSVLVWDMRRGCLLRRLTHASDPRHNPIPAIRYDSVTSLCPLQGGSSILVAYGDGDECLLCFPTCLGDSARLDKIAKREKLMTISNAMRLEQMHEDEGTLDSPGGAYAVDRAARARASLELISDSDDSDWDSAYEDSEDSRSVGENADGSTSPETRRVDATNSNLRITPWEESDLSEESEVEMRDGVESEDDVDMEEENHPHDEVDTDTCGDPDGDMDEENEEDNEATWEVDSDAYEERLRVNATLPSSSASSYGSNSDLDRECCFEARERDTYEESDFYGSPREYCGYQSDMDSDEERQFWG